MSAAERESEERVRFRYEPPMVKLLICTLSAGALALCVLQLRQQRLQINYQTAELHEQIRQQQGKLWNQQLQIAQYTAPNAISKTVDAHDLKMVPQAPLPRNKSSWIDVARTPEAE
jgi:cell division protein FtsL